MIAFRSHLNEFLSGFLWISVFSAGLLMKQHPLGNSLLISNIELFFISAYVLSIPPDPKISKLVTSHRIISVLLIMLLIVSAYSIFFYNLTYMLAILVAVYSLIFLGKRILEALLANRIFFLLILLWMTSVGISYLSNSSEVYSRLIQLRYEQTIMHTLFFIAVWSYFRQNSGKVVSITLVAIPASAVVVVFGTLLIYFLQSPDGILTRAWYHNPPFN